jgi:hypothetical protein
MGKIVSTNGNLVSYLSILSLKVNGNKEVGFCGGYRSHLARYSLLDTTSHIRRQIE